MNDNTCICCGEPIPEGRQVCPKCEKDGERMNNIEIIKNFIMTGKAIYELSLMEAESEGLEIPDSITVSATGADGKIIEITIAIKDGDTEYDQN